MALWAERMFWATVGSVVVSFAGLVLIGFTLSYTRRAADASDEMVKEAKATTEAARKTLDATWKIGKAQVAAYLTCTGGRFVLDWNSIEIDIDVANVGHSPATECRISGYMLVYHPDYRPLDERKLPAFTKSQIASAGYATYIPAKLETGTSIKMVWAWSMAFDREIYTKLIEHGAKFEIECKIVWRTVFENDWHDFNFLMRMLGNGITTIDPDTLKPSGRQGTLIINNMMQGSSIMESDETY